METMVRIWYAVRHINRYHIYPEYLIPFRMTAEECKAEIDKHRENTGTLLEGIIVRIEEKTVRDSDGNFVSRETKETAIERYPEEV